MQSRYSFSWIRIFSFSVKTQNFVTLISGFRRDVDEVCGLLGCYTASCGTPEDRRFNFVTFFTAACNWIISRVGHVAHRNLSNSLAFCTILLTVPVYKVRSPTKYQNGALPIFDYLQRLFGVLSSQLSQYSTFHNL
jgi:hypothetical protein